MEESKISKFKTTCLAVLARVRRAGNPVVVTRFGKPIARIVPPPRDRAEDWLGCMRDRGAIPGELVALAGAPDEWSVRRTGPAVSDRTP